MAACGYRALVAWTRGHVDQAVAMSRAGLEHALALGHPMSVAQAMVFAGWVRLCRREPDACREHAEAAIDYCTKHALPFWFPNGHPAPRVGAGGARQARGRADRVAARRGALDRRARQSRSHRLRRALRRGRGATLGERTSTARSRGRARQ